MILNNFSTRNYTQHPNSNTPGTNNQEPGTKFPGKKNFPREIQYPSKEPNVLLWRGYTALPLHPLQSHRSTHRYIHNCLL